MRLLDRMQSCPQITALPRRMNQINTDIVFKLGDRLPANVYGRLSEGGRPMLLLAAGKKIETEHQLQILHEAGFTVIWTLGKQKGVTKAKQVEKPGPTASFGDRLEYGMKLRRTINDAIKDLNGRIHAGESPQFTSMLALSEMVANDVASDPQAFSAIAYLSRCDDYTVEHSADVSILMVAIGRVLGVSDDWVQELALAGLLHDVGKQMVPPEILQKSGPLTESEFKVIRRHPEYGMRILADWNQCPVGVTDVAFQHHERLDGTGYPLGCVRNMLHPYSLMAAVADAFDAMTANRCYHVGTSARHALTQLYSSRDSKYDRDAVDALIKLVGAYPIGTRVRLSTGEAGVVVEPNFDAPAYPIVEVDTHPSGRPMPVKYRVRLNSETCWIVETDDDSPA